jgi:drug/metabolite transporter (DMT)-like permease
MASGTGNIQTINFFALFIILATVFYGLNVNILKYYLGDMKPIHISSISMLMIGPFALLYLIINSNIRSTLLNDPYSLLPFFYVVILGVVGTAIAMSLFNKLIMITNTVFASSVTYLIPVIAVIWGLIDGEILHLQHYFGMTTIIIGVLVANKGRNM